MDVNVTVVAKTRYTRSLHFPSVFFFFFFFFFFSFFGGGGGQYIIDDHGGRQISTAQTMAI